MNLNQSYLGFTDNLPPMTKHRVEKILDKIISCDGRLMSRKDFMVQNLVEGYGVCSDPLSFRKQDGAGEKIEYRLSTAGKRIFTITKTEYDFGCYLTEKGLLTEEAVQQFLLDEHNRVMGEERQYAEAQQRAHEAELAEHEAQRAHELWMIEQVTGYTNQERLELLRAIFHHMINGSTPPIDLLVLIENIENPRCRAQLQGRLHIHNKASRKVFECITGLTLPKTNKDTTEFLSTITISDYGEPKPFKARKKPQKIPKKPFYIAKKTGGFVEVQGEPLFKYGFDMFIHVDNDGMYKISEAYCGANLASGKTKTEALSNLKEFFDRHTIDGIRKMVYETVDRNGSSPGYKDK